MRFDYFRFAVIRITTIITFGCMQAGYAAEPTTEERLENLEQRLKYTEQRISSQDKTILDTVDTANLGLEGLLEIDATKNGSENDISVSTLELSLSSRVTRDVSTDIALLYEGETLDVDQAIIRIETPYPGLNTELGLMVVPFGYYDTHLLSDSLGQQLGETQDEAIRLNYHNGHVTSSLYLFNGENGDEKINNYGLSIGSDLTESGLAMNASFINDITQSNTLAEAGFAGEEIRGSALYIMVDKGPYTVSTEYITALDDFSDGSRPDATRLEASVATLIKKFPVSASLAYEKTRKAASINLAEQKLSAATTMLAAKQTTLGLELSQARDYEQDRSNNITARLAITF